MLVFILSISFFIHALSLAAIYLMYQQVQKTKNSQMKEIDQLMGSYIEQIQIENSNLQESLHTRAHLNNAKKNNQNRAPNDMEKEFDSQSEKQTQYWNPESLIQTNNEDLIETSLESRVLQLHRAGVEINEIAKQLHCGKTEASLIIQFQMDK